MRRREILAKLPEITDQIAATYGTTRESALTAYNEHRQSSRVSKVIRNISYPITIEGIGALVAITENPGQVQDDIYNTVEATREIRTLTSRVVFQAARHPRDHEQLETARALLPVVSAWKRPLARHGLRKASEELGRK